MWSLPKHVLLISSLALAFVLTTSIAAVEAAEAAEVEGTLCEGISADALNALSPIAWGEPVHADEQRCVFWLAGAEGGRHSVVVSLDGRHTLDELRPAINDGKDAAWPARR